MSADSGVDPLSKFQHDLRTPINHILGYSELIEEKLDEPNREALGEDLQKITTAARNLLALISSSFSREGLTALLGGDYRGAAKSPTVPKSGPAPEPETSNHPAMVTGRILVVDDDQENREVLARRLERQGHTAIRSHDGEHALALVRSEGFDLVLLDVMMPGLDGFAVLSAMKSDPTLRHIPVIMISALDEMDSVVRCIKSGAEDYLPKPFNPTLLRARIGASLEKKALRDQEQRYLHTIEETQERLKAELREAANYVRSILPEPAETPFRIVWRYIPSTELGGDSFGYHWIDNEHFAMYLLDVCGHGVGAALLSVSAINVLRSSSLPNTDFRDPGAVLSALNETFPMETQNNMYFTIWYGVYNRRTRQLRHASGGHPDALLLKPDGKGVVAQALRCPGLVIGAMPGMTFASASCEVPPGSSLLIVSDGTYEIKKPNGEMVSFEECQATVQSMALGSNLPESVLAWAQNLNGSGAFEDDFSLVQVEFPASPE